MKLEFISVRDMNDNLTGKVLACINETRSKDFQMIYEMEKLLDVDYTNSDEYDRYYGLGISYVIDSCDKKEFKEAYKSFKPIARNTIDEREYE